MNKPASELIALDKAGLDAAVRECARITAPEISDEEYERIVAEDSLRYRNTRLDMERKILAYLSAANQSDSERAGVDRAKLAEWADDFEAAAHEVPRGIKSTILMTRAQEVRVALATPPAQPAPASDTNTSTLTKGNAIMTDDQVKHMVDRFLGWKLPENFSPDGGVSFEPFGNAGTPHQYAHSPIGTNLLDAAQATVMVRHMLDGMPTHGKPDGAVREDVSEQDAESAIRHLKIVIDAAENSNQSGENAVVRAALVTGWKRP